ncbi:MAG: COX15/CtaA family protein [Gaiellales bacterium]
MASADIPVLEARSGWISARSLRIAAAATLALLWLVVTTGALVRLTASGLGCPHWPTCEANQVLPMDSRHALIEFSNRVISGIAMLAAVGTAFVAYRLRRLDAITGAAMVAAVGTVAQVPLGAVTVAFDLNPILVMSHFLLAMIVITFSTWMTVQVWRGADDPRTAPVEHPWVRLAAWAAAACCVMLVTTGAFVTAAGPHPGSETTPIRRLGNFYWATWTHVRAATAFGILLLGVTVWLWRNARSTFAARLCAGTVVLSLVQFGVGEYQYRNGLPWQVIAVHVALAATLLVAVVSIATLVGDEPQAAPGDLP